MNKKKKNNYGNYKKRKKKNRDCKYFHSMKQDKNQKQMNLLRNLMIKMKIFIKYNLRNKLR